VQAWEEEVEEVNEYGEKEKIRYVIEPVDATSRLIKEMYLTEWSGFSAWRYRILFEGDRLRVMWSRKANLRSTFEPICELIYDANFEEWPWFTDPEELEDAIKQFGVKKTYGLILVYIKMLFLEPFEGEAE
jgi:hypothetical protein